MSEFFASGGVMMWPILAVALGVLWIAVRTGVRLAGAGSGPGGSTPEGATAPEVARGLQGILFWGAMAVVLGFLGTTVGVVVMARAVALAGAVEAPLIWGGVGVALVTLAFGLAVFLLAALLWFLLRSWEARVQGAPQPERGLR